MDDEKQDRPLKDSDEEQKEMGDEELDEVSGGSDLSDWTPLKPAED